MSRTWLGGVAAAFALAACTGSGDPAPTAAPAETANAGAPVATAGATPAGPPSPAPPDARFESELLRLRGNAVMGKDGYGVVPCGQDTQRIVSFEGEAKTRLDAFLAGGAREFFIDGWSLDAAGGKARLMRLERIYTEGPGCEERLAGVVFVARGTEPFWSVRAGLDGVIVERPGVEPLKGKFTGAREDQDGERVVETTTSEGPLTLRLARGQCSDGMSDAIYGWTARLTIGDQAFRGCAYGGFPADRD